MNWWELKTPLTLALALALALQTMNSKLDPLVHTSLSAADKAQVQEILRAEPELWQQYGNLFEWTRDAALDLINPDTVQYQSTVEGLNQLRDQFAEEGDGLLERMAIEQIITAHIQAAKTGFKLESMQPNEKVEIEARFWVRAHNLAQSRLLRTMQALTRLRKANLDIRMKLWRNRPLGYNHSSYLYGRGKE